MSQEHQTQMKVAVQITGIPDDIRVTTPAANQLSVSLSGKGTSLRKSGRRSGRSVLQVNYDLFSSGQGHAALSTRRLMDSVYAMLPASVSITKIEPDSLVMRYALQQSVTVPVQMGGTTESLDQFFVERVEFKPESVCAKVLLTDTLPRYVVADVGTLTISSDTTVVTVGLKPIPGVLFDADEVRVSVYAQQYTEKSLEVPVTGVNFPEHVTLKSFPSKAVLTVWVKMSEYDKIDESDFQVVVDYNDIAGRDNAKAMLRIYSQPASVRNVRLQTRSVDYLMETMPY